VYKFYESLKHKKEMVELYLNIFFFKSLS